MYNIKKNIDRLNSGNYTFFLDPNEAKEVTKYLKKINIIYLNLSLNVKK